MRRCLALALLAAGCATTQPFDRSTEPGAPQTGTSTAGGTIITRAALTSDPSRTVLDVIRQAMPQVQITGWTDPDHCPRVELRGRDVIVGSSDPDIYVDGVHSKDTCLLTAMRASETGRLEVYPFGVTSRPGYPSSPHGLILIFLARSDST